MEFADKLRSLISDRGWTDTRVAKAIKVHSSNIGRWTKKVADHDPKLKEHVRRPTPIQMVRLARLFEVSVESLVDDAMPLSPGKVLSPDEAEVLATYRLLRNEGKVDQERAQARLRGEEPFGFASRIKPPDARNAGS